MMIVIIHVCSGMSQTCRIWSLHVHTSLLDAYFCVKCINCLHGGLLSAHRTWTLLLILAEENVAF